MALGISTAVNIRLRSLLLRSQPVRRPAPIMRSWSFKGKVNDFNFSIWFVPYVAPYKRAEKVDPLPWFTEVSELSRYMEREREREIIALHL